MLSKHRRGLAAAFAQKQMQEISDADGLDPYDSEPDKVSDSDTSLFAHPSAQFLKGAELARLLSYQMSAGKEENARKKVCICNLEQSPKYMGSYGVSEVMPALLRASNLYDVRNRHEIVPAIHWLIQGWPLPGIVDPCHAEHFPFPSLATASESAFNDREVRRLCGNSMHVAAIGTVLTYALAIASIARTSSAT